MVVKDIGDGSGHFLHSKEGVTQGDPYAICDHGKGFPLGHAFLAMKKWPDPSPVSRTTSVDQWW